MSQPKGSFDMSKMTSASKIMFIAGALFLINTFLPWQRVCFGPVCGSASGASGIGILNLLLAIALLAWEGMALAGVDVKVDRALVSAAIGGAIVVITILKIIVDSEAIYIFAWIGLILAAVIGYGAWMKWQEHQAGGGGGSMPAPPPDGGGFTS